MIKKRILFVSVILLFFALTTGNLFPQQKGIHKSSPPFLITGKIPHLTKMLMQQWENADLALSDDQKDKLLIVRKDTISNAKRLGKEIAVLEDQVAEGSIAGKTPEELRSLVEDVATLKTEATMVHLNCIYRTSKILDAGQLEILKR